jgi:hypothetical protein
MWMVAMETKIKHFKCISYHAKIIKFSFGHKDFHITDFITKCQVLWKTKCMGQKTLFSKKYKEATHDYFLYVLDKCLLNGYKHASFTNLFHITYNQN